MFTNMLNPHTQAMSGDLARNVILAAFRVQTMVMLILLPVVRPLSQHALISLYY